MKFQRLYDLVLESVKLLAWLDPHGNYHSLPYWQRHGGWAEEYLTAKNEFVKGEHPVHQLNRKGWQRITWNGPTLITSNPFAKPNLNQMKQLKVKATNEGYKQIMWDNENRDIILWSSDQ